MGKKNLIKIVTPAGVGSYVYADKPDTEGEYADGKYKTSVVFDKGTDLTALNKQIDAAAKAEWGRVPKDLWRPWQDGDEKKDKDGNPKEEFAGKIIATAKSQFAPTVVDAKRQPLPKGLKVFSGDLIKVSASLLPFKNTETVREGGKRKKVDMFGVTLQLRAIQLLEKRNTGGAGGADDFEDESDYDGFDTRDVGDEGDDEGGDAEGNVDDF